MNALELWNTTSLTSGQQAQVEQLLRKDLAAANWESMIGPAIASQLTTQLGVSQPLTIIRQIDHPTASRILFSLPDGNKAEAVLLHYEGRKTVCVSSQVGCAMGCRFCATGGLGFTRNLTTWEIISQVRYWQDQLPEGESVRNVVFMGMGEPLNNVPAVRAAAEYLIDPRGMNLGRRVTISTVGIVPEIAAVAQYPGRPRLALSLHAATNPTRKRLLPVAQRWSIEELTAAIVEYENISGEGILYEWTIIPGINDTPEELAALAELLSGRNAHLNLIPYHPGPSPEQFSVPSRDHMLEVQQTLQQHGLKRITVRTSFGERIAAACGQLAADRDL